MKNVRFSVMAGSALLMSALVIAPLSYAATGSNSSVQGFFSRFMASSESQSGSGMQTKGPKHMFEKFGSGQTASGGCLGQGREATKMGRGFGMMVPMIHDNLTTEQKTAMQSLHDAERTEMDSTTTDDGRKAIHESYASKIDALIAGTAADPFETLTADQKAQIKSLIAAEKTAMQAATDRSAHKTLHDETLAKIKAVIGDNAKASAWLADMENHKPQKIGRR